MNLLFLCYYSEIIKLIITSISIKFIFLFSSGNKGLNRTNT